MQKQKSSKDCRRVKMGKVDKQIILSSEMSKQVLEYDPYESGGCNEIGNILKRDDLKKHFFISRPLGSGVA